MRTKEEGKIPELPPHSPLVGVRSDRIEIDSRFNLIDMSQSGFRAKFRQTVTQIFRLCRQPCFTSDFYRG